MQLTPLSAQRALRIGAALLLIVCAGYILAGVALTPFHGDEATQIYMSRDYAYQFMQRDLSMVRYANPPISAQEQELRLLNGTVNKYLIGLAWHAAGFSPNDLNEQWDWGADWAYNQSTGHAPGDALLQAARIPSAVLFAFGVIPVFIIGYGVGGWWGGFVASGLYALSPMLLVNGRRAMMEGSLIAFSAATVGAGMLLTRRWTWGMALLLGAAAGLALASKHTAIFTVAAVFGAVTITALVRRIESAPPTTGRWGIMIGFAGVIAAAVFLLLNPAWWDDPVGRVGEVLRMRSALLEGQSAAFGSYPDAGAALAGFFRQAGIGTLPQYFEIDAWADYLAEQISTYQARGLGGLSLPPILSAVGWVLAAIGAADLAFNAQKRTAARVVVLTWALAVMVFTAISTPLEWGRYYLTAHFAVIVLVAAGVAAIRYRLPRLMRHFR